MKNNKAQMEMSVGTIVTIVLLVTLLILGVVLVKNIFSSATSVVDLTNQQLTNQISQLFSQDSKTAIYPDTRLIVIKQDTTNGAGLGIQNLLQGSPGDTTFSYVVNVSDSDSSLQSKCGINGATAENWIVAGGEEDNMAIPSGGSASQKILFQIPTGAPLCVVGFNVNVYDTVNGSSPTPYATDYFDLQITA